jgi:hypothetical protein
MQALAPDSHLVGDFPNLGEVWYSKNLLGLSSDPIACLSSPFRDAFNFFTPNFDTVTSHPAHSAAPFLVVIFVMFYIGTADDTEQFSPEDKQRRRVESFPPVAD